MCRPSSSPTAPASWDSVSGIGGVGIRGLGGGGVYGGVHAAGPDSDGQVSSDAAPLPSPAVLSGDLGCNGLGIPVGKLDLYVAAGGFHPSQVLPCVIDVGTNNESLRSDPWYMGLKQERLTGEPYYTLVDEFVKAVMARWPEAVLQVRGDVGGGGRGTRCVGRPTAILPHRRGHGLLAGPCHWPCVEEAAGVSKTYPTQLHAAQFEDFALEHAANLLDRYRHHHTVFNDDIQVWAPDRSAGWHAWSIACQSPTPVPRTLGF